MQSNRLLKVFGNAREMLPNRVRLLVIADTHNALNENELIEAIKMHPYYDACLLLGDHSDGDLQIIIKYIPKDKIYALLGNHDFNYGIEELNNYLDDKDNDILIHFTKYYIDKTNQDLFE